MPKRIEEFMAEATEIHEEMAKAVDAIIDGTDMYERLDALCTDLEHFRPIIRQMFGEQLALRAAGIMNAGFLEERMSRDRRETIVNMAIEHFKMAVEVGFEDAPRDTSNEVEGFDPIVSIEVPDDMKDPTAIAEFIGKAVASSVLMEITEEEEGSAKH